ncbi:MAG: hypothetical protein IJS60_03055 [Abditibacteriota bacterium]|nr:hypothetical protein [Abditibacteriota bacterium]
MLEEPYAVENCEILDYRYKSGHFATFCPHCHKKHLRSQYISYPDDYPKLRRDIICNWCGRHYLCIIHWH